MLHLDTHVVIWLRAGDRRRLKPVASMLGRGELRASPFVLLELQMLFEIGRLREPGRLVLDRLQEDHGVSVDDDDLETVLTRALDLSFTRDPFDRMIAAHALAAKALLITADETLLKNVTCARWAS